jgi:fibronectin-binding autotransporter adhesin
MKLFLRSIALLALASFTPFVSAQTTPTQYWVAGTSGDFNTTANWGQTIPDTDGFIIDYGGLNGTAAVPGKNDIAYIPVDSNVGGSFVGGGATGTLTITQTTQSNLIKGLQVSNIFFGDAGAVNFASNAGLTLTVTGTAAAGAGTVNYGDVTIAGGTTFNYTGGNFLVNKGVIVVGLNSGGTGFSYVNGNFTAVGGTGTLNINSGTFSFDPSSGGAGSTTELDLGSGTTGTMTQGATGTASTVTTGNYLNIGYAGGTGNYTLSNGSVLQTGSPANAIIGLGVNTTYAFGVDGNNNIGPGTGSIGNLTIGNNSTVILNSGADLQVGTVAPKTSTAISGGTGTITQSGTGSTVTLVGSATMELGDTAGSTGTYNLEAGTLNIGNSATSTAALTIGAASATLTVTQEATGFLNQSGGSLVATAASTVIIGNGTQGTYTLSGGTADFQNGFVVSEGIGGEGTVHRDDQRHGRL